MSGPTVLAGVLWACAAGWAAFAAVVLHGLAGRKALAAPDPRLLNDGPLVSVLMPARNEAGRVLARSVRSALAQDYGRLEVLAVNDRSTDETEALLRSLAETDGRLRVINGAEPPAGWLGKPYALQQALEASRGEWVLTLDADMLLEKEAVRAALGHALGGGYDVLTLMPHFEAGSFWERVFTPAWVLALLGGYPFAVLNSPRMKRAFAFGGFSLIRRRALARVGEFAAVRADIVEDVRLAELLKGSGARYRIEHAPNLARTRMQTGFREIWNFLLRGMFAGMGYSLALAALTVAVGCAFVVAPVVFALVGLPMLAAGASGTWVSLLAPCLVVWATQVGALMFVCKKLGVPPGYALTTPLGLSLFYAALLQSAVSILRRRGVSWRGRTVYERAGVAPPAGWGKAVNSPAAGGGGRGSQKL